MVTHIIVCMCVINECKKIYSYCFCEKKCVINVYNTNFNASKQHYLKTEQKIQSHICWQQLSSYCAHLVKIWAPWQTMSKKRHFVVPHMNRIRTCVYVTTIHWHEMIMMYKLLCVDYNYVQIFVLHTCTNLVHVRLIIDVNWLHH